MALSDWLKSFGRHLSADFTELRPPWQARSVRWAALLVLVGLGVWVFDLLGAPPPDEATGSDSSWPLTLRLGISYIGGFLLGWVSRRYLRILVLVGALALTAIFLLRRFDMPGNWESVERHVRQALGWARSEGGMVRRVLQSSLPSAAAAGLGGVLGFFYCERRPAHVGDDPQP